MSKVVTMAQAAEELAVSERSVRRYLSTGHLTGIRVGPRMLRITRESLDKMLTPASV